MPYNLDPYQQIRVWWNAVLLAEHDPERVQGWGGAAISVRLVLRALGAAAQMTGLTAIEFGVRCLSLMTGLHYDTVADVLRILRDEDDAFIYRVETRRGERADLYVLQLPDQYREMALWQRWRAGNIQALHPAFRCLGGATTALVYEHLTTTPTSRNDLIRLTGLSPSTVSEALAALLQYELTERTPQGWSRGPEDLDILADFLGAGTLVDALRDIYRDHRAQWHAYLKGEPITVADIVDATAEDGHIPIEPAWHDRDPLTSPGLRPSQRHDDDLQRLADAEVPPWLDDHLGSTDFITAGVPDRDPTWERIWGEEVETGLNPLHKFCSLNPSTSLAKKRTKAEKTGFQ